MASDLSKLLQDGLCDTLQNLLGTDVKLNGITQVHEKDLENLELLKVEAEFVFEKLSTIFSFVVPAHSASMIFNIQMGDTQTEPSLSIDDDTLDAINEFISTVSGGLTTTMNGAELEDLGVAKFNIKGHEILKGEDINEIENMYRFSINLDENEIIIFILFDENILPFVNDITLSPITEHLEPEPVKEPEPQEVEDTSSEAKQDDKSQDSKKEQETEDHEDDSDEENPKNKKIKKIIVIVGGLLAIVLIAGVVMYFMGMFDEDPIVVKKVESNTTKEIKGKVSVIKYKTPKKINFKLSDIDIPRLNLRLAKLTKYQVLTSAELEKERLAEKKRLIRLEKEKKLLEFAKRNKEEPLKIDTTPQTVTNTTKVKTVEKKTIVKKEIKKDTLLFILANSLKYKLFKDLVRQTNTTQARISICTNKQGRTTIFIGPFENDTLQTHMQNLIKKNNSTIKTTLSNITQKEFDARCNF